jgi:hypothetical protein
LSASFSNSNPNALSLSKGPAFSIRRPMMAVASAALICNCSTKAIENAILDGKIEWAFDVALPRKSRKLVRVLTRCVFDHLEGVRSRLALPQVLALVFPESRARLRTAEISWAFHVDQNHAVSLVKHGAIKALPGTGNRVNQSPQIPRASIVEFLSQRRIVP